MKPNHFKSYYGPAQSIRFTMTTPEEERALFVKAKEGGCQKSKEFLINNYLLFAKTYAESLVKNSALQRDEIISAANFGIIKAYEGFDYKRGFRFSTYARSFIRGEIATLWKSKFSGDIPDPSICSGMNLAPEPQDPDNENYKWKFAEVEEHEGERLDLRAFNRTKLAEALATLSERDAELIRQHYVDERSFADIGRERGVTREAVRASHSNIVANLKKALAVKGVEHVE